MQKRSNHTHSNNIRIGSKAVHTASLVFVGKFISLLMLAASFIIVVRILGPQVYGVYTLAIAVSGFFDAVGNFGISTALNKFVTEFRAFKDYTSIAQYISNGLSIVIISGIILAALTFVTSGIFAQYSLHNINDAYVIQIASLSIIVMMLFGAANGALIGFQSGKYITLSLILVSLVQSSLSIILALAGYGALSPLFGLILAYLIGFIAELYLIYVKHQTKLLLPRFDGIKKLFKFAFPIAGSNFMRVVVNNFALILLGAVADAIIIGNFGVASKTGYLISIVTDSISISLISAFSSSMIKGNNNKTAGRMLTYAVYLTYMVGGPILVSIILFSTPLSYTAFSSTYALSPIYISIFAAGFLLGIVGMYASQLLISANRMHELIKYNIGVTVIELIFALLLIPTFNGIGAAITVFMIAPLTTSILFSIPLIKSFNASFGRNRLIRVFAANFILGVIFFLINYVPGYFIQKLIVAPFIIMLVYPPILGLLNGITKEDAITIRKITSQFPIISHFFKFAISYAMKFAQNY